MVVRLCSVEVVLSGHRAQVEFPGVDRRVEMRLRKVRSSWRGSWCIDERNVKAQMRLAQFNVMEITQGSRVAAAD